MIMDFYPNINEEATDRPPFDSPCEQSFLFRISHRNHDVCVGCIAPHHVRSAGAWIIGDALQQFLGHDNHQVRSGFGVIIGVFRVRVVGRGVADPGPVQPALRNDRRILQAL